MYNVQCTLYIVRPCHILYSLTRLRRSVAAAVQKQSFDIETAAKDDQLTNITDKPTTAVKSKAGMYKVLTTMINIKQFCRYVLF